MIPTDERLHLLSRKFLLEHDRVFDNFTFEERKNITEKFYKHKHDLIKLSFINCTVGIDIIGELKYTLMFPNDIMLMISPIDDDCVISIFKNRELIFSDGCNFKNLPDKWNTIKFD